MRKALPIISEDAATLKQRLQREHDGRKKPRLQMLDLLASGWCVRASGPRMWTCNVANQSNRPILLPRDRNACHILTSVPNPPRLPIRSGASMCTVVTIPPCVTT
jgi:hypothetical protein